jgi:hypothetical protein
MREDDKGGEFTQSTYRNVTLKSPHITNMLIKIILTTKWNDFTTKKKKKTKINKYVIIFSKQIKTKKKKTTMT